MTSDPFELFDQWFADARSAEPNDPEAMALATADSAGRPSVRMVLLKGHGRDGFVFYTNREGRKGRELAENLLRPVRWRETRAENLTAALMAREEVVTTRAAVAPDGRLLGLACSIEADFGAWSFFPANYMARVIAQGRTARVDVGEVNGSVFVNNASLGIYPKIVRERTHQQRRFGRSKRSAMLWATLAALHRSPLLDLRLELEEGVHDCRAPFVFVGNNAYVLEGFDIGKREHRVCRRGHGDDDIRAARRGTGACCSFTLEPSAVTRRPNSSAASSRGSRYWTRPIVATSSSASR